MQVHNRLTTLSHLIELVGAIALGGGALAACQTDDTSAAAAALAATPAGFELATHGCAMAHCDPRMSDLVASTSPTGSPRILWTKGVTGPSVGVGCASNGSVAACTVAGSSGVGPFLYAFDADGTVRWSSGTELGSDAMASAPMVSTTGEVIAADSTRLVRFDAAGQVAWRSLWPSDFGNPISPSQTAAGSIVAASSGGYVVARDAQTGAEVGSLVLSATVGGVPGRFVTHNTPAIRGERIYVSTEFVPTSGTDATHTGRLYAIDLDPSQPAGSRMTVAWFFEMGSTSGASPLAVDDVIYFDGDRLAPNTETEDPHFFAVRDLGTSGALLWTHPLAAPAVASAAQDPRGGLWVYASKQPTLTRLGPDGTVLQALDVDALVGEAGVHHPASPVSVQQGPAGQPYLVFTAAPALGHVYAMAVDAAAETVAWKVEVGHGVVIGTSGQFPVVRDAADEPVVICRTDNGVVGIGAGGGGALP
jgi:hypothetical protein